MEILWSFTDRTTHRMGTVIETLSFSLNCPQWIHQHTRTHEQILQQHWSGNWNFQRFTANFVVNPVDLLETVKQSKQINNSANSGTLVCNVGCLWKKVWKSHSSANKTDAYSLAAIKIAGTGQLDQGSRPRSCRTNHCI